MSSLDKIIDKFKGNSDNITFKETQRLLEHLGYMLDNKGKTSGSRVKFYKSKDENLILHKPHPRNTLLAYQRKAVIEILKKGGKL